MDPTLVTLLIDPRTGHPLRLVEEAPTPHRAVEPALVTESGESYSVRNGIPRFVRTADAGQRQTEESFGFKWKRRDSYDSEEFHRANRDWLVQRYGFADIASVRTFFANHRLILDAGCGSGFSSSLWMTPDWQRATQARWVGADISEAIDVARDRLGEYPGTSFVQADLMDFPFAPATFDLIFCEGVMHHTPSTRSALGRLARLLSPGGHFLFYIYRKKAVLREFTDDFIRDAIAEMKPEEAWEALRSLTRLGQALAQLKVSVEVPEDVPLLGIKAGTLDVQRFIYWNIAKLYWRDSFSFEENHHVNFDWYHPRYAHRHTEDEVMQWCREERLDVEHLDVQESGITVRATRAA